MSDSKKPLFLEPEKLEDPPGLELPTEAMLPAYDKPLNPRQRVLALMVAKGCTNEEIEKKLGYAKMSVRTLKGHPAIKREIQRLSDKLFDKSLEDRMKDLGPAAMDVVEEAIAHDTLEMKDRVQQARWLLEKLTGKPAQQVDHRGQINLSMFMDKLQEIVDVTPDEKEEKVIEEEVEVDPHAEWLDRNL